MHSTFITPPDLLETVVIIDASQDQIREVGKFLQNHNQPYTIYLYNQDMNDENWLRKVYEKSTTVLQARGSKVSTVYRSFDPQYFGDSEELKNPVDFFNK